MRKRLLRENRYWSKNAIKRVYEEAVKIATENNLPIPRKPTQRCAKCGRTKFGWCECEPT